MPIAIHKERVARLQGYVQKRCAPRQIDPTLVAPRRNLSTLVQAAYDQKWPIDSLLLKGWRAELLGENLPQMLRSNFAS